MRSRSELSGEFGSSSEWDEFDSSSEWEEFDPGALVEAQHDDALATIQRDFAPLVEAMQPVIARIYAIEEAPARPASSDGACTPLWRDKFEFSDENFMTRVVPLTVLRILLRENDVSSSGLLRMVAELSQDSQQRVTGSLVSVQAQLRSLCQRLGPERVEQWMTQGLETRVWSGGPEGQKDRHAAREAARGLLGVTDRLERILDNALIKAAVRRFDTRLPD